MPGVAMIVDDNQLNLETLAALLHKEGMHTINLLNPHDISTTLDTTGEVAVVFLDIEFPNDDGFHIIKELQKDPRLADVPIVAYSVHISELQEAHDAGFHSFLGKPLNVSAFPSQLRRILNGEAVWDVGQ